VGGAGGVPGQSAAQEEVAEVGGACGQHQFVSLHVNGRVKGNKKHIRWYFGDPDSNGFVDPCPDLESGFKNTCKF